MMVQAALRLSTKRSNSRDVEASSDAVWMVCPADASVSRVAWATLEIAMLTCSTAVACCLVESSISRAASVVVATSSPIWRNSRDTSPNWFEPAAAGSNQFGEVSRLFRQIGELVATTTEAAREIELSTKQQATAVEQVNIAISNVAQATRETEASAGQTIQTASELASTSRELLRLVDSRSAA